MVEKMTKYFPVFAFLLALPFGTPALSQDAPPESMLIAPMGEIPQPQPQTSQPAPKQPASSVRVNNGGFDPCPEPSEATRSSPDDLAKVQEDIDRFTLCVARAQLLERLNETATKSDGTIDSALGLAGTVPGLPNMQSTGMAPLPSGAFAETDMPNVAESPKETQDSDSGSETAMVEAVPVAVPWSISEIYGAGASIQAKLISPDGDEVRVREGEKLRDGGGTIVRITPSMVTVRAGSDVKNLDWSRQ